MKRYEKKIKWVSVGLGVCGKLCGSGGACRLGVLSSVEWKNYTFEDLECRGLDMRDADIAGVRTGARE